MLHWYVIAKLQEISHMGSSFFAINLYRCLSSVPTRKRRARLIESSAYILENAGSRAEIQFSISIKESSPDRSVEVSLSLQLCKTSTEARFHRIKHLCYVHFQLLLGCRSQALGVGDWSPSSYSNLWNMSKVATRSSRRRGSWARQVYHSKEESFQALQGHVRLERVEVDNLAENISISSSKNQSSRLANLPHSTYTYHKPIRQIDRNIAFPLSNST